MPIREYACPTDGCRWQQVRRERFEHTTPPPPPRCECGAVLTQLASAFAVTFVGDMTARYNDPKKDGAHREGQWVVEKKNTPDGNPRWRHLQTWQDRKQWMKQEGLIEGSAGEAGADGKSISTAGMPGSWL